MSQDYAKPFGTLGTPGYRFLDVYPRKPSFGGPIIALAAAAANLTASAVKAGSTKRAAKAAEAQAAADAQARQIEAYYAAAAAQQDAAAQAAATQQLITAKTQRQKRWALYGLGALAAAGSAYVIYRIV